MNSVNPVVWFRRALGAAASGAWPASVELCAADVFIGAEPLSLAAAEGTPFVRNMPSGRKATGPTSLGAAIVLANRFAEGDDSADERFGSVLVTRVEAVLEVLTARGESPFSDVWVDAELPGCLPDLAASRVIGRVPTAGLQPVRFRPCGAGHQPVVELPADLRVGDLLAIPCAGPTALYDVQRHSRHIERLDH